METVWDYNVTDEEQRVLTFPTEEEFVRMGEGSSDLSLYLLFSYRGQDDKAAVYFKRLPEDVKRPMQMQDEFELRF